MSLRNYLKSKIARRLVISIVLMSSVLTLIATIIQLFTYYKDDINKIDGFLEQVETSYQPIISNSLWEFNSQQLQISLEGILAYPGMEYVEISHDNTKIISLGTQSSKYVVEKKYPLSVNYYERETHLGTLRVVNSLDTVYQELFQKALTILVSNGVKTFLVSLFILYLVHQHITKQLFSLISKIRDINIESDLTTTSTTHSPKQPVSVPDEFQEVQDAIVFMQKGLETSFIDLKNSQARYKRLFERSPIPLWEEDFTKVIQRLNNLNIKEPDELRAYLSNNPDQLSIFAQDITVIDVNIAALQLHNANSKNHLLGNLDKIFTQKSFEAFREELVALGSGQCEFNGEGEVVTLDGEIKTVSVSLSIDSATEEPVLALLATTDITQRIAKEREFEMLATAIEHITESVVVTNHKAEIIYVNSSFEEISGYTSNEVLGQSPKILNSGLHDPLFYRSMWATLAKGDVWQGQLCNKRKDGRLYYEEASITPITTTNGKTLNYVAVKRDITEERKREKQLLQAQKMESIGNLAGGIAHDFNNILSSIIGFSEIALGDIDKNSETHNDIQEVLNAGIRAKDLVQQILLFARQSDEVLCPIKIEPVISEVVTFLESTIPTTISIETSLNSSATIQGNSTQLHQVLMNLCTNAVQSIGNSFGNISICMEDVSILYGNDLKKGGYVKLTVSDDGKGISPENLDIIFEPYFSTKDPGEGTGLGLSVVQGIVKNYGGTISVDSTINDGTTFTIHLPALAKLESEQKPRVLDIPRGTERILLVDDEVAIAKMEERILSNLGYTVTTRTSSIEALELFKIQPTEFDLLISDMTMPNMTGDELAIACMKIRPDLPVILCTGYSNKLSQDEAEVIGVKAFTFKPIVKADLATTIRDVLDQNNTRNS